MSVRQLKIQTGVVKRLDKEHAYYIKEADSQRQRIAKMESEGADEYTIRKQHEVLDETLMIIPDTKKRLEQAHDDPAHADTPELTAAQQLLTQLNPPTAF